MRSPAEAPAEGRPPQPRFWARSFRFHAAGPAPSSPGAAASRRPAERDAQAIETFRVSLAHLAPLATSVTLNDIETPSRCHLCERFARKPALRRKVSLITSGDLAADSISRIVRYEQSQGHQTFAVHWRCIFYKKKAAKQLNNYLFYNLF